MCFKTLRDDHTEVEVRGQRSEVSGQWSEIIDQKSEVSSHVVLCFQKFRNNLRKRERR